MALKLFSNSEPNIFQVFINSGILYEQLIRSLDWMFVCLLLMTVIQVEGTLNGHIDVGEKLAWK